MREEEKNQSSQGVKKVIKKTLGVSSYLHCKCSPYSNWSSLVPKQ